MILTKRVGLCNLIYGINISIYFQMIETECFRELNVIDPDGGVTPDLIEGQPPPPPSRNFFDRLFRRRVSL